MEPTTDRAGITGEARGYKSGHKDICSSMCQALFEALDIEYLISTCQPLSGRGTSISRTSQRWTQRHRGVRSYAKIPVRVR